MNSGFFSPLIKDEYFLYASLIIWCRLWVGLIMKDSKSVFVEFKIEPLHRILNLRWASLMKFVYLCSAIFPFCDMPHFATVQTGCNSSRVGWPGPLQTPAWTKPGTAETLVPDWLVSVFSLNDSVGFSLEKINQDWERQNSPSQPGNHRLHFPAVHFRALPTFGRSKGTSRLTQRFPEK